MKPEDATNYCGKDDPVWYNYDLNKGMWLYLEGSRWLFASIIKPNWIKEIDDKTRSCTN